MNDWNQEIILYGKKIYGMVAVSDKQKFLSSPNVNDDGKPLNKSKSTTVPLFYSIRNGWFIIMPCNSTAAVRLYKLFVEV